MNAYELDIRAMKNPRMADIINTARKHISSSYLKLYPWAHSELNHGKGILVSDDALNCYLVAYGIMHMAKVRRLLHGCALEDLKPGTERCSMEKHVYKTIDVLSALHRVYLHVALVELLNELRMGIVVTA